MKLIYNHHRIRKYTQLAAEKAQIREQLQRTASVKHGGGNDIPFGIRALESGIEVDGVWISGSNTPAGSTPVHSAPGSPTLTPMAEVPKAASHGKVSSDRASLPSQITRIEMPPQAYGHDADRRSISQPGSGRASYQPRRSSGLRFSNSNDIYSGDLGARDAALAALEGRIVGFGPAEEVHEAHRRSKSWATTSWNESHDPTSESSQAPSSRPLLHPPHHPSIRLGGFPTRRESLESEDHHEISTLQDTKRTSEDYLPRMIRAPMSYEDLPDECTYQHAFNYENAPASYNASERSVTPTQVVASSQSQHTDAQGTGINRKPVHLNRPLTESTENTNNTLPTPSSPENTVVQYPHETIEQPRRSQVIRKINSGFEILRPGTLGSPRQSTEIVLGSLNGIMEHNTKREPKKLHRRRGDANLAKA